MKISSTQLIKQLKEITAKLDDIEFLIFNLNNENYHTVFKIIFKYLKEIEYQLDILQKNEINKEVFNLLQDQYYNITLLIEKMADKCF
ncbi:TPA: hypothetical protein QCY85_005811 [Bacillus cereus]|uniref:hypothetical protein n=1 Tax=Bacillus cereus group sp. FL70 TaxID=3040254 RepID=UPI0032F1B57A|nr:hypothetical protein [Bacillus cereus]